MLGLLGLDGLTGILAGALVAIVAVFVAYFRGESHGESAVRTDAEGNDNARAKEIEEAADSARAGHVPGADANERLRDAGHLRD